MGSFVNHYNLAIIVQEMRRGAAIKGLKRDVAASRREIRNFNKAAGKTNQTMVEQEKQVNKTAQAIKRALITAFVLAAAAMGKFAADSIREFAVFDQKLKETFTLIPEASQAFKDQMSEDIREVNLEFGKLSTETLPALYQALSAGIPKENAVEAVRTATMAAIAGAAELDDTMRTGMAIVNAYGGEIYDLGDAYDILFTLIAKSPATMTDLNANLSRVTSVAAESRTPLEDLATALGTMMKQGDSAAEATELLSLFLMQLGTDGTAAFNVFVEAAGVGYREYIANGGNLIDALILLDQYSIDTGKSLSAMIAGDSRFFRDQQAARAALELTGIHMAELISMSENFADTSGVMGEAFATASDNIQFKLDRTKASFAELKLQFAEFLLFTKINENVPLFGGLSGEDLIDGLITGMGALTGEYERNITAQAAVKLANAETLEDHIRNLKNLRGEYAKSAWIGGQDAIEQGMINEARAIAGLTDSYDQFVFILSSADVAVRNGEQLRARWSDEVIPLTIKGTNQLVESLYAQLDVTNLLWRSEKRREEARLKKQGQIEQTKAFEQMLAEANQAEGGVPFTMPEAEILKLGSSEFGMSTLVDNWNASLGELTPTLVWARLELTKLSTATINYMDSLASHSGDLFDNYDLLMENSGEWVQVALNNSTEVQGVLEELAADLTDEQSDAMWDMVRTAEEGGDEWLSAWNALQGDLTETQRFELVAQMADFKSTHGEMQGIWSQDKTVALAAAEGIIEALALIEADYKALSMAIALENLGARFGTDSAQFQQAVIDYKLAIGEIGISEHAFLTEQLGISQELDSILTTMWANATAEGPPTMVALEGIAKAEEIIKEKGDVLTKEGLEAYLRKALDDEGYPAVAGYLLEELGPSVDEVTDKSKALVDEGPYDPEFGMDKKKFEVGITEIQKAIKKAIGPHWIVFKYRTEGSPPGSDGTGGTDADAAHGTVNFRVPSGYPGDSFLMGLTSGEVITVKNRGQQAQDGIGAGQVYTDNRIQNVIINNHTRAAAKVANAQLDALAQSRASSFAGG